jgi:hypothetical protein
LILVVNAGSTYTCSSSYKNFGCEPTDNHFDSEHSPCEGIGFSGVAIEIRYSNVMSISGYEGSKTPTNHISRRSSFER